MTALAPPQPPTIEFVVPPEDLFERVRRVNPFTDNRVNGPAATDVDVDDVHQAAFERLTALAAEACAERRGLGAVLWGEAGIGKSHLLSRLHRWAERDQHACLVYLHNLQASPENLPRSLLKAVVNILTRGLVGRLHRTPLFQLTFAAVGAAMDHDTTRTHPWPVVAQAFGRFVDRIGAQGAAEAAVLDRAVYGVLFQFFRSAIRARHGKEPDRIPGLAVRWLGGDFLDPDEARLLGLPPGRGRDEATALADNQQIKQVLVALSRLALARSQPFVLCFDQVDNLDEDQAAALARFLEALIDSSPNLLVVTAGIQASLLEWKSRKVIQDSAWDRLAQFEVPLHRISPEAGRQIVRARLERFLEPFAEADAVPQRTAEDALFPLGTAWADEFFRDRIDVRPRDVVNAAREAWRREQEDLGSLGGAAWLDGWRERRHGGRKVARPTAEQLQELLDAAVARKVAELQGQRLREPGSLPPDADHFAGLVRKLLDQCRQIDPGCGVLAVERREGRRGGDRPPYQLLVRGRGADGQPVRIGLLFLISGSATTTAACFRRLVHDADLPERLVVVTDERQPPPLAARGREYRDELAGQGPEHFAELPVSFAEYAHLDALVAVVELARSGDLEMEVSPGEVEPVREADVLASHHRQGRYRAAAVLRDMLKVGEPA